MGFGSVKVLCKSKIRITVCCGVSKVTQQLPIPVCYEVVRDHLGQRDKSGRLLVKWLLTERIVVKLSLLTSTRFCCESAYPNICGNRKGNDFGFHPSLLHQSVPYPVLGPH